MAMTPLSPGVQVNEIDLTGNIPAVGTSASAFVGNFAWGPVEERTRVSRTDEIVQIFGKPTDGNFVDWFTAANFLSYSGMLYLVRVVVDDARNATGDKSGLLVKNQQAYNMIDDGATHISKEFIARYPGALGNSLAISIADQNNFENWQYANEFDAAPGTSEHAESLGAAYDEVHVVVVDKLGEFTGIPGTILERHPFLSKAKNAKALDGSVSFYGSVINLNSQYVWWIGNPDTANYYDNTGTITDATGEWGTALIVSGTPTKFKLLKEGSGRNHSANLIELGGGQDGTKPSASELVEGWELFKSVEEIDVGILMTGDGGGEIHHKTVVQNIIDNIVGRRKDCVVTYSPKKSDVMNKTQSQATQAILKTRNDINRSSSYAIADNNWKLIFDVYNNKYRWIPCNSDVAGLMAETENNYDAWWSPAGFNRGKIKNVVQLAFNPNEDSRTELYKQQVNSIVSFVGEGPVLYGDKTQQAKSSAFQYINVRRLFITLEKAIGKASRYMLFEINDEFTRASFRAMVQPYLREVKGRRGIYDFHVVCDETNNTPEVIDSGNFVGSIYIKPARSINNVRLDFVATRTGVDFKEVIGKH